MKAYIYLDGEILSQNITEHPAPGDLSIAADSGYFNAEKLGERVDILLGDMDSLGGYSIPGEIEVINYPPEKDLTDAQLAVDIAIGRGADNIIFIGGLDGRLDHTLSLLGILEDLGSRGIYAMALSGLNRVRYLKNSSVLIPRSGYKYLSVLACDEKVRGVSVEGCKYPLENARLSRWLQYAVSNEIEGNCALVSVRRGGIFIIESRDKADGT